MNERVSYITVLYIYAICLHLAREIRNVQSHWLVCLPVLSVVVNVLSGTLNASCAAAGLRTPVSAYLRTY